MSNQLPTPPSHSSQADDYAERLARAAAQELHAITSGTKPFVAQDRWKPVAYAATAPARGVVLDSGLLRDCFDRNIAYLNRCFGEPFYCDAGDNTWVQALPASAEGRLLAGAGHTLRWGERTVPAFDARYVRLYFPKGKPFAINEFELRYTEAK
jgi:hypothetical protein